MVKLSLVPVREDSRPNCRSIDHSTLPKDPVNLAHLLEQIVNGYKVLNPIMHDKLIPIFQMLNKKILHGPLLLNFYWLVADGERNME